MMEFKCYVKDCNDMSRHQLEIDGITVKVCGDHYDDTSMILDDCQDVILKAKRDAIKKIRRLTVHKWIMNGCYF